MSNRKEILKQGFWSNNVGLVQLLGLCPLLAVTSSTINGLGMGLATTVTLLISSAIVSLSRNIVPNDVRIPVFVLIIAATVTVIELLMNAYFYDLYLILGIFIPLIVTNCAIIGRAESFASRNNPIDSVIDAFAMGMGFTLVLVVLGAMREALGFGTLFRQADLMFGEFGATMQINLIDNYREFLIVILPPGAFIGLGLLVAFKNLIEDKKSQTTDLPATVQTEVV